MGNKLNNKIKKKKYDVNVATKKNKTVSVEIKSNETEEIPMFSKGRVSKLCYQECNMMYLGENRRKFQERF